ncbi:bifunctional biotin--[acetyl-CoA-carboxylase] synthetase/biotin operon repressor, partial [Pseudomonas syringae pv. pisi str. 1704B]
KNQRENTFSFLCIMLLRGYDACLIARRFQMLTLLKLLADGAFHSGQVLGDALGISRSAVWKQLQQLEADLGIDVHKVRGRGYRLATPISLLSPYGIEQSGFPANWSVRTYDSIDSTNAEAARLITQGVAMPVLVVAE